MNTRGGGTLVRVGMILATLAFTSWWSSQTIFNPDRTARVADSVLTDSQFRGYLASVMAPVIIKAVPTATALAADADSSGPASADPVVPGSTGVAPGDAAVQQRLADALGSQVARTGVEDFLTEAHRSLIGEENRTVTLDAATVDALVAAAIPGISPEEMSAIPPVSYDVPRIGVLLGPRRFLADHAWMFASGAAVLVGVGMAVSKDRRSSVKTVGRWLIGISLGHLLVLYVLPVFVVPALTDNPWVHLATNVAKALGGVISVLVLIIAAGVALTMIDLLIKPPGIKPGGADRGDVSRGAAPT